MPKEIVKIKIMRSTGKIWTLKLTWKKIIDSEGSLKHDSRYSIHGNDDRYPDDYLCGYELRDDTVGEAIRDVKTIKKLLTKTFKANGDSSLEYKITVE